MVLESTSVSYGKATSYLPVIDLFKSYFKIQERDELREIREKVTGKLLALDRTLELALPGGARSIPGSAACARSTP